MKQNVVRSPRAIPARLATERAYRKKTVRNSG